MAIVFQINHDSYSICRGRNMPPFSSYAELKQILSVSILVKRGPGDPSFNSHWIHWVFDGSILGQPCPGGSVVSVWDS